MTLTHSVSVLALLIFVTRGFGQSALSVVSLGIIGKTPLRNRGLAMGVFAVLTGLGFAAAIVAFQEAEAVLGAHWRLLWGYVGAVILLIVLPVSFILCTEPSRRLTDQLLK